ncbi:MAG TPA: chemotaxis protein CheA, partial [Terriglobales bacterium]|nr:chemotaxis protein CheA [Terriglobales bacterium]
ELLQSLNEDSLKLEHAPQDREIIRSIRRTVHTLKGDSAAVGFHELSELAHTLEDALAVETPSANVSLAEIGFTAADIFGAMLVSYRQQTALPDTAAIKKLVQQLASHPSSPDVPAPKGQDNPVHAVWSEYERVAAQNARAEGKSVFHMVAHIDPLCAMPIAARQLVANAVSTIAQILASRPEPGAAVQGQRIELLLATSHAESAVIAKCQIPTVIGRIDSSEFSFESAAASGVERGNEAEPTSAEETREPSSEQDSSRDPRLSGSQTLLRVDAERIDNVLNLVGELIIGKSMMQQAIHEYARRSPKDPLRARFADAMSFQARVLNDLQRSVMKIRMVPVDQLFRRFPRMVRDVGLQCGKQVELVVKGGDTDLDKGILDAMAEPLTHLVRNAVGHGIESAEERVRAGKRAQGTLRLNAYHQGNQVVIEVSDDGHGIDANKVRQRALSQGLVSAEQAARLSEGETLDLIFQPGFSTAAEITELSGRGVGLDVVQSVLGRLKGTAQIDTEAGRGTTFRLRLPLTLAIIKALLFRVEQRLYAIPLNAVAEITRTVEEHIHQVEHYDVLQLRNEVLPLLRLGRAPEAGPASARHKVFVLVINSADRKFGLIVDALVGEEELVIKALDDQSLSTDLVSGASILGDGRVVLILNLTALVARFTRARTDEPGGRRAGGLLSSAGGTIRARGAAGGQA